MTPQHGVDGWVLEDMDWDPITGLAIFEYSSTTGQLPTRHVRPQPIREGHVEWNAMHDKSAAIFEIRN